MPEKIWLAYRTFGQGGYLGPHLLLPAARIRRNFGFDEIVAPLMTCAVPICFKGQVSASADPWYAVACKGQVAKNSEADKIELGRYRNVFASAEIEITTTVESKAKLASIPLSSNFSSNVQFSSMQSHENKTKRKVELSEAQRTWLKTDNCFPPQFELSGHNFEIQERNESGHVPAVAHRIGWKGFVLKVRDIHTDRIYAAKFCLPEDYAGANRTEVDEAKLSAKLNVANGLFAIPMMSGRINKFSGMPGNQTEFVCFIGEWVEGKTLEHIFDKTPEQVTPQWVCQVARELFRALNYLEKKELKHDDLHTGNIMLRPIDPDMALDSGEEEEVHLVIIDTGSLKGLNKETPKSHDDYSRYIETLVICFNTIHRRRQIAAAYPQFLAQLKQFIEKLSDEDITRHFPDFKSDITREIHTLEETINAPVFSERSMFTPFDAISAEHLADDRVLLKLFVEELPWMPDAFSRTPCVLTGPRGCGKSMLFRFLATKTHLVDPLSAPNKLAKIPFLGVYISSSSDLQNNLLWIAREPDRVQRFANHITTFFQLVILRELFRTLAATIESPDSNNRLYGITETAIGAAIRCCEPYLPSEYISNRLRGLGRAQHFSEILDTARVDIYIAILNGKPAPFIFPDELLKIVTASLQEHSKNLLERPIVFLLDDYTEQRVSKTIQRLLNKIVWQRCGSHAFKISCERYGFDPGDIDQITIEGDREFSFIDAGRSVVENTGADSGRKQFVIDLLNRRLIQAGWSGRAEQLIGDNGCTSDTELAKRIRISAAAGHDYYYSGLSVLANIWSGDIASLLHVIREMFVRGKVSKETTTQIGAKDQHEAIRSVSEALNARIRAFHPFGHEMHQIVTAFGTMVREVLVNGSDYNPGKNKEPVPRRMIRIEMATENAHDFLEELGKVSPSAADIARELTRRAIFIELSPSRAKEGQHLQTVRWQLRRILLPFYGSSLLRTSYIDVKNIDQFSELFVSPQNFCEQQRIRYGKKKAANTNLQLFDIENQPTEPEDTDSSPALEE